MSGPLESLRREGTPEDPGRRNQELERAMQESLRTTNDPQPGQPLQDLDLQRSGLYFEHQHPSSDTCGLNALNNICQKKMFKISDLQVAEAKMARAQDGGTFAQMGSVQNAPKGFFDVEALKIAADDVDLEIVDVEPVLDFQKSRCRVFVESARRSADGSWFLGFLVYDRRPGQMHYYTLRRDGRYEGAWVKLDSQLPQDGEEARNRWLTEEDLRALYEASRLEFRDWLIRWFPVVYRSGAAREVCKALGEDGYEVSTARAMTALRECGWVLAQTTQHLLQDLPRKALRELLVKYSRPSEVEMRSLLAASQWDVAQAQPTIYQALQRRIALAQSADTSKSLIHALSLSDWDPSKAATLLALSLQMDVSLQNLSYFAELHQALSQVSYDVDKAEAVLRLQAKCNMEMADATSLLRQMGTWSVQVAERVLQVRRRFPRSSVAVCLEVLKRNDNDPHAAGEMLAEYEKRVQRLVAENSTGDLGQGEEVAIAESALNSTDWDPNHAFIMAKNLAWSVQQTRHIIRNRGYQNYFSVEVLLPALTAGDLKPQTAASYLLGTAYTFDGLGQHTAPVPSTPSGQGAAMTAAAAHAAERRRRGAAAPPTEDDDSVCVVA